MEANDEDLYGKAGEEVRLVTSPEVILPQISQTFNLTCSWDIQVDKKKDPQVLSVLTIAIQHQGKTIASYGKDLPVIEKVQNMEAIGKYDDKNGYISLSFTSPSGQQSGKYSCLVGGRDKEGSPKVIEKTVEVTHVDYIKLVAEMESLKAEEKNRLDNFTEKLKEEFTKEMETLKTELKTPQAVGQTKPEIFFSVGISSDRWIQENQALICDVISVNQGGNYDKKTGIFSAPVPGFYRFEVHLNFYEKKGRFALKVNGQQKLYMWTTGTASNSFITHLKQNDSVGVFAEAKSWLEEYDRYRTNTFSGQLVAMDKDGN